MPYGWQRRTAPATAAPAAAAAEPTSELPVTNEPAPPLTADPSGTARHRGPFHFRDCVCGRAPYPGARTLTCAQVLDACDAAVLREFELDLMHQDRTPTRYSDLAAYQALLKCSPSVARDSRGFPLDPFGVEQEAQSAPA